MMGMALISAFNTITGAVEHQSLLEAMRKLVPAHRAQHIERNALAIDAGRQAAGRHASPFSTRGRRGFGMTRERPTTGTVIDRRRPLQGLRALHRGLSAERAVDVVGAERKRVPLSRAQRRLHRMHRLPADLPGLRLRGLSIGPHPMSTRHRIRRQNVVQWKRGDRPGRDGRWPALLRRLSDGSLDGHP